MPSSEEGPLLVYDGDCAFCVHWVRRWQALTGPAVRYAPYQQVSNRLPQIAPEAFRGAVQYIVSDGRVAAGAEASLLIEATFIAVMLSRRERLFVRVVRWLLFRVMWMAGLVKAFGDPAWRHLGALRHHFESKPLPTPLAWHVAQLSDGALAAGTAAVLVIELVLPFFVPMPRRLRFVAAGGFALLQLAIAATGNYAHCNLLVVVLCVALLDGAALRRVLPNGLRRRAPPGDDVVRPVGRPASTAAPGFAVFSVGLGLLQLVATIRGPAVPDAIARTLQAVAPLRIVNAYGPFTVVPTERAEIVIEGSRDGVVWREYRFRWKPGDVRGRPGWIAPAQPRLDWQMWS